MDRPITRVLTPDGKIRAVFGGGVKAHSIIWMPDWGQVRVAKVEGGVAITVATGPKPKRQEEAPPARVSPHGRVGTG